MRMWNVDPKLLCRKHLLSEHFEMHMFVGSIRKGKSIAGYVMKGLVEPLRIVERHNEIAEEMLSRGYNHKSPLAAFDHLTCRWFDNLKGCVDQLRSMVELYRRCDRCRKRIGSHYHVPKLLVETQELRERLRK